MSARETVRKKKKQTKQQTNIDVRSFRHVEVSSASTESLSQATDLSSRSAVLCTVVAERIAASHVPSDPLSRPDNPQVHSMQQSVTLRTHPNHRDLLIVR